MGLAAGIFVEGVLLRGAEGYAGQVGHTRFIGNDVACACGKTGCWVTEVGAAGILRKLEDKGVKLNAGEDWVEGVQQLISDLDPYTFEVLNEVGSQLGQGLARLVQSFNPSTIIVGGRLGRLLQSVEPAIRESLQAETLPHMAEALEIIISNSGDDPLIGCLATIFDDVMKNPPLGENLI